MTNSGPEGQETFQENNFGGKDKVNKEEATNEQQEQDKKPTDFKKIENDGWILAGTYLVGWLIILIIFKLAYNRYQRNKQLSKKKWYPNHPEKEAYEELIAKGEGSDEVLRKALLRRAMTDIRRVWELQEEKEVLHKLTRSGAIPESMWNSYKDADHDMQLEIYDLQAEAETFKPGWSQAILKEAAQLIQRERELQALRNQINREVSVRTADPKTSAQEKKHQKKELLKTQQMAEKMINKKYGIASGPSSSIESLTSVDEKSVENESSSGEEESKE